MSNGTFYLPMPVNEPVLTYAPGSPERKRLKEVLAELKKEKIDVPMYIGGEEVRTGKKMAMHPPHEIKHTLGHFHEGEEKHITMAIECGSECKGILGSIFMGEPRQYIFKSSRSDCHQIQAIPQWHHHALPE